MKAAIMQMTTTATAAEIIGTKISPSESSFSSSTTSSFDVRDLSPPPSSLWLFPMSKDTVDFKIYIHSGKNLPVFSLQLPPTFFLSSFPIAALNPTCSSANTSHLNVWSPSVLISTQSTNKSSNLAYPPVFSILMDQFPFVGSRVAYMENKLMSIVLKSALFSPLSNQRGVLARRKYQFVLFQSRRCHYYPTNQSCSMNLFKKNLRSHACIERLYLTIDIYLPHHKFLQQYQH